jgi:hypothetical protein
MVTKEKNDAPLVSKYAQQAIDVITWLPWNEQWNKLKS